MLIVLQILPTTAVIMLYQLSQPCSHDHKTMCEGCLNLTNVLHDIHIAAKETDYSDEDLKDDIQYKVVQIC